MNTPGERRRWVEAIHERNHAKSVLSKKGPAITEALGQRFDKEFVLKTISEVLGIEPELKDSTYYFDKVQVTFDEDGFLHRMSEKSGDSVVIEMDENHVGDT